MRNFVVLIQITHNTLIAVISYNIQKITLAGDESALHVSTLASFYLERHGAVQRK
jgi:hypothetical protein